MVMSAAGIMRGVRVKPSERRSRVMSPAKMSWARQEPRLVASRQWKPAGGSIPPVVRTHHMSKGATQGGDAVKGAGAQRRIGRRVRTRAARLAGVL